MNQFCFKKYKYFYLLLIFVIVISCQQEAKVPGDVKEIIEDVKQQFHPDWRISVFDVTVRHKGRYLFVNGEILSAKAKEILISRLNSLKKYEVIDSLTVLPTEDIGEEKHGIVRVSVAQIRRGADIDKEIVTQELMGARVNLLKKHGWWYYVQLEDQYLGWVMKSSLVAGDAHFLEAWEKKPKLIVTANYGQIWEEPRPNYCHPVSDIVMGNKIINLGLQKGWYHVELPDGRKGYVQADKVKEWEKFKNHGKVRSQDLVELAYRFLGIPYFWGGRSTKGFDCSGFTQTIYKMNGIQLPRDANMQIRVGSPVVVDSSLENLKPGDLLFFGRSKERVTHVGMYIGNSKFIHSDGMVHINSFDPADETYSEYRRKGLQAVRRILEE